MCRPPRRSFWPRSPSICKVYRPPVPLPCSPHHAARRRVTFSASSSEQPTPAAHWKGRESAASLGRLCPQSPLCFSFCSGHWWTPTRNGGKRRGGGVHTQPRDSLQTEVSSFLLDWKWLTLGLYGCAVLMNWLCLVFSFLSASILKVSWFRLKWDPGAECLPDLCSGYGKANKWIDMTPRSFWN